MKLSSYSYLTIEHLRILLGYKDLRSVKLWCEQNGVFILKQGNAQLVNGAEFMLSFYRPFIEHLKRKHHNWKERFLDCLEGNLAGLLGSVGNLEPIVLETHLIETVPVQEEIITSTEVKQTPLIYPKKERISGIYAYCQKCKTSIGAGKCKLTKKRIQNCEYPEFHTFRASVVVPGTGGLKRRKKILNTTDIVEAIRKKKVFEQTLRNELQEPSKKVIVYKEIQENKISQTSNDVLLLECFRAYIKFLEDDGVAEHQQKKLGEDYIKEIERYLNHLKLALESYGWNSNSIKVDELSAEQVGWVHTYLLEECSFSNRTYNKAMGYYAAFYTYVIEKLGGCSENPFLEVTRRKTRTTKTTLTKEEFQSFLSFIKPQYGYRSYPSEMKQFYRDWLSLAYEVALETGLRREEYIKLKFENIKTDEKGVPVYMMVENYKVNRKGNFEKEEEKEYKVVPITPRMHEILQSLDFDKYRGADRYLIAPETESSRQTMINHVSKAFTHFWSHTGIDRKVEQKHLRKTYLTAVAEHFGDKAAIISNHSSIEVLIKHYVDDKALIERSKDFKVF